jgi:uncharacterized protein YkwD
LTRLRLPLSLALLCVLVATAVPASSSAAPPAKRMIDAINWSRASYGLPTLHRSRKLSRSATRRARRMIRADFFAHPTRLRVPRFDRVGEVLELHGGRRARVGRTLRRWGRSPTHRLVLLTAAFRYAGAGRASGWYRGQRATIWVVRLGRR